MELTSEQKHDISVELNASDIYETVPFLNKVLAAIGYVDRLDDDSEREELRWTKRKEPLIKDKKIRKAVRAWAEANGFDNEGYYFEVHSLPAGTRFCVGHYDVEFIGFFLYELKANSEYTLAELCGEED